MEFHGEIGQLKFKISLVN